MTVLVAEAARREVVDRAVARLSAEGVTIELSSEGELFRADIVVAVRWPLQGRPLVSALRAMAAGRAAIVAETHATAAWPALDPQTWRARDQGRSPSRRRSSRSIPGTRSIRWCWRFDDWQPMPPCAPTWGPRPVRGGRRTRRLTVRSRAGSRSCSEAAASPAPQRPDGWPAHLDGDGSRLTRQILAECGFERVPGY